MKKISLCIPSYNRTALLYKSFEQVKNDPRIKEIVIVDDGSNIEVWNEISEHLKYEPKVKLFRNETNLGVYANKKRAVELASSEYVIIFDSDNVISVDYLDKICLYEWDEKTVFAPAFARPAFNYRKFSGPKINRQNAHKYIGQSGFDCLLNTMNFFCNRLWYLACWQDVPGIDGQDSIWMNYLMFKAGGEMYVVPGLEYDHLIHDGSNYQKCAEVSAPKAKEIEELLRLMR